MSMLAVTLCNFRKIPYKPERNLSFLCSGCPCKITNQDLLIFTMLLHFSENPDIPVFRPHVARTAVETEAYVWAVDEAHAPAFWFPRDCPRACCWQGSRSVSVAATSLLGLGGARRMHAIESDWLGRVRACRLFAYQFDPAPFRLHNGDAGFWTTEQEIRPFSVEPVGDLLERHVSAGIELRVVPDLWPLIDAIIESGLDFSIIRKANAKPRQLKPV